MNSSKHLAQKIKSQIRTGEEMAGLIDITNKLEQTEQVIKKKIKKSDITNMLGDKKPKMDKPIGKLYSIGNVYI